MGAALPVSRRLRCPHAEYHRGEVGRGFPPTIARGQEAAEGVELGVEAVLELAEGSLCLPVIGSDAGHGAH